MKRSTNTKSLTKSGSPEKTMLTHERIVSIIKQILSGLSFMNSKGFFHRDIKPENILVNGDIVKVADFGLARQVGSQPPFTYYVSTRWYRAPEVILHSPYYGPPIDLFACGLLLSELYTLRPLFPGTSEIDQIHKMTQLLGQPTEDTWREGVHLMKKMNMRLLSPSYSSTDSNIDDKIEEKLRQSIRGGLQSAANLVRLLIQWNPSSRPSADEALRHDYFGEKKSANDITILNTGGESYAVKMGADVSSEWCQFKTGNDENLHMELVDTKKPVGSDKLLLSNQTDQPKAHHLKASRFKSNSTADEQPNEFCDYLNRITSSDRAAAAHQAGPRGGQFQSTFGSAAISHGRESFGGHLQSKSSISSRYRPRQILGDSTPYKPNSAAVAQTIMRSAKRRGRQSLGKSSSRKRVDKPKRWSSNLGKRTIEVHISSTASHALEAGDSAARHRGHTHEDQEQRDSVWNPF